MTCWGDFTLNFKHFFSFVIGEKSGTPVNKMMYDETSDEGNLHRPSLLYKKINTKTNNKGISKKVESLKFDNSQQVHLNKCVNS